MRLFLALELPADARQVLAEVQRSLKPLCLGWRWVRPEGIHLTMRFLGEVSEKADADQRPAWRETAAGSGPIRFHLGGVGTFPSPKRPRVLWVGVHDDTSEGRLGLLAHAVEQAARGQGFVPERRSFHPHLTLARAASGERPAVPPPSFEVPRVDGEAGELVLFRSHLGAAGARYTRMETFPLVGSED